MIDLAALQAAGVADAPARAGLIEYLDGLGFTAEQMVEAERRGRLFGLAGDVLGWSGPPIYSLRSAAETLGVPVEEVARAWVMLGLTIADRDELALSQADVDMLTTWIEMRSFLGEPVDAFLRVLGATMARLAEAESSMIRNTQPDVWLGHTDDELTTARAWRAAAGFIPRIGAMLDAVHRHHQVGTRTFLEGLAGSPSAGIVCGVGFADLSGFTALTRVLTPPELSALLTEFGGTVADMVHADGGRVVKFIGDAVMWVSSTPELLAKAAVDLVTHPKVAEAGLQVRAGLGYGEILPLAGDYFGNPVNLAARLVGAAAPGQILVADNVRDLLPDWPVTPLDPLSLKGFDAPITAYELNLSTDR
ncbi:adenylate/guanylate cyclase domain-containing protein [Mycobacterium sp. M1]|uniref:Adenylate/guanylate cyclase domain-containing protein n=1 Tax=Mycolicibacter acidiphilus TaxID=2835306 RepID=A0ABS5RJ20_9MYCO|nr:adenylate/guanylate cyclase domain-containing protein [Mycolicibacter acidiphilus]MBS9532939.1 adenylate/guanylate cyclase domain-containing protein [Mycolicibacter acidiphilus]